MTSSAVVTRYATALADAVCSPQAGLEPAEALNQARRFEELYKSSKDLRTVLASPSVSMARKRTIIKRLADDLGLHRLIRSFLLVLVDHRRAASIGEIIAQFDELLDTRHGFVRVSVTAAHELGPERRAEIDRQFAQLTGQSPRLNVSVDPDLIGGMVARVGSRVYDGSVRAQLAMLRRRLEA